MMIQIKKTNWAKKIILAIALTSSFGLPSFAVDKYQAQYPQVYVDQLDSAVLVRRNGDLKQATQLLEKLAAEKPKYYRAQYNLGLAYADAGDVKKSIEALLKADKIRQDQKIEDPTLDNSIGWAYLLDGQYNNAEKYFQTSIANKEKLSSASLARVYNNYAQVKIYQKKYKEAAELLQLSVGQNSKIAGKTLQQISSKLDKE